MRRYALFKKGDTVLIGVSGGPDSVALLYCLAGFRKEYGIHLHVAHLDHMLRKNSGQDSRFVERICKNLGVPCTCARIDCKALSRHGSVEELCRNARIGFLVNVCRRIKADAIALGHTLDDQAETVLMRLLRGTGLQGLSGIAAARVMYGIKFVRPLIEVRRKDVERFLARRSIKPCIDASNLQDIYFRNRIRNNLIPLLEKKYSPAIKELLSNLAESASLDYDYILSAARRAMPRRGTRIPVRKFLTLHPSVARQLTRLLFCRLKGDTRRLTFTHVKEVESLCLHRPDGSIVDLPSRIRVKKQARTLAFYLKK
ncbi:MAG: tRNA lysidine(34) synthetase TilS [Candidatus Omnitrophica bacterium]|nr:tRNA lysidine(34) synthetase TilS [Candidatus Omnitrophota bacterium]